MGFDISLKNGNTIKVDLDLLEAVEVTPEDDCVYAWDLSETGHKNACVIYCLANAVGDEWVAQLRDGLVERGVMTIPPREVV